MRRMFRSKIHRATVTQADFKYEGSVTINSDLIEAADILPHEEVHVWNVTRGTRLTTYAMAGQRGTGVICINGAAAHLVQPGDVVIIATFTELGEDQAKRHNPLVVLVDDRNQVRDAVLTEVPGPLAPRRELSLHLLWPAPSLRRCCRLICTFRDFLPSSHLLWM